jgi:hypothetical protein
MPISQEERVRTGRAFHNDVVLALLHRLENVTTDLVNGKKALTDDGFACVKSIFYFYNSILVGDDYERSVARMGLPTDHEETEKDFRIRRHLKMLEREYGPQAYEVVLCEAVVDMTIPVKSDRMIDNYCIVEKGHPVEVPHVAKSGAMRDNR